MQRLRKGGAIVAAVCGATMMAPAGASAADAIYGLTDDNRIVRFNSDSPGRVLQTIPVQGLQAGETLVGIDVRPATDALYAVTSASRVYQVNPVTGGARIVIDPLTTSLNGTLYGVDFNPVADALRIISDADQNLRVRFSDGRTFADSALNYGDGVNPAVSASAYTNNVPGATSTTLFDIDAGRDTLVRQDPPNAGTLGGDERAAVRGDVEADQP